MNYYAEAFRKYAVFKGRARRKEYWYFVLFNFIVALALSIINDSGTLYAVYVFAAFIPGTAVGVRRLHDIGKSGWWLFIAFIPLVGAILLILDLAKDSQPEKNEYGPNPKEPKEIVTTEHNAAAPAGYCHKCGSKVDVNSKFCTSCGSKINTSL